jgi:hypothetical protein
VLEVDEIAQTQGYLCISNIRFLEVLVYTRHVAPNLASLTLFVVQCGLGLEVK